MSFGTAKIRKSLLALLVIMNMSSASFLKGMGDSGSRWALPVAAAGAVCYGAYCYLTNKGAGVSSAESEAKKDAAAGVTSVPATAVGTSPVGQNMPAVDQVDPRVRAKLDEFWKLDFPQWKVQYEYFVKELTPEQLRSRETMRALHDDLWKRNSLWYSNLGSDRKPVNPEYEKFSPWDIIYLNQLTIVLSNLAKAVDDPQRRAEILSRLSNNLNYRSVVINFRLPRDFHLSASLNNKIYSDKPHEDFYKMIQNKLVEIGKQQDDLNKNKKLLEVIDIMDNLRKITEREKDPTNRKLQEVINTLLQNNYESGSFTSA